MLLTALVMMVAAPAAIPLQNAPAGQDGVVTGERPKSDRRLCKRRASAGSPVPKAACRTPVDWNLETQRSIAAMDRFASDIVLLSAS
ncbi:MAG: hypothetical protein EOP58_10485 [Sphingomonadales bacterium]|nr:MAG: hypothetical protein EOP58_10485 [Sphingomonadales bacterium]